MPEPPLFSARTKTLAGLAAFITLFVLPIAIVVTKIEYGRNLELEAIVAALNISTPELQAKLRSNEPRPETEMDRIAQALAEASGKNASAFRHPELVKIMQVAFDMGNEDPDQAEDA